MSRQFPIVLFLFLSFSVPQMSSSEFACIALFRTQFDSLIQIGIAITNLDKLMPSNEDTRHKCEREKKKKKKRLTNMKGLHLPSRSLSPKRFN